MSDIFDQWKDGNLTDLQAIRALCSNLGEIESELAPLEAEKQATRDKIAIIIDKIGTTEIAGFGKLEMTSPTVTKSYSKDKIDELIERLCEEGYWPIAQRIRQCRTESPRAGGLRITREKSK